MEKKLFGCFLFKNSLVYRINLLSIIQIPLIFRKTFKMHILNELLEKNYYFILKASFFCLAREVACVMDVLNVRSYEVKTLGNYVVITVKILFHLRIVVWWVLNNIKLLLLCDINVYYNKITVWTQANIQHK